MNKEELEKEAQRSFDELDDWCVGDDWSIEESYKNGFSNGAEPREKRIAELKVQIEKMKCCENCRYCNEWGEANSNSPNCKKCNWVSNWKLRG